MRDADIDPDDPQFECRGCGELMSEGQWERSTWVDKDRDIEIAVFDSEECMTTWQRQFDQESEDEDEH